MSERLVGRVLFNKIYIFSKLDEIITHNMVTRNQNTGEREEQVLHLVEYGVSSEEDIMIVLEEDHNFILRRNYIFNDM